MTNRSVFKPIMVAILIGLTIVTSIISYWIWQDVKNKRYTDLESTAAILARYYELALEQRELALVSVGKRMLDVDENVEEERLKIAVDALEIYTEFLAFGLTNYDGSMITFTGNVTAGVPNLMQSELTRRSFEHARSGTRISIGEPYYFEQVNDWILPVRTPMFEEDSLLAINTSAIRYQSINDNLENFGFNPQYRIHAINTAFNTTQIYYPLENSEYDNLLRKDASIYRDFKSIKSKSGFDRVTGFNSYEGYSIVGVRIISEELDRAFIVSVDTGILLTAFWNQFIPVILVYLLLCSATIFGFNYLIQKDNKHRSELEEHNRKLELQVKERTKELQTANEELNTTVKELNKALKDLKETQHQLIRSEKMASLGILAAGVGHEINNPLNFIHGGHTALVELLQGNGSVDKEVMTYLDVIAEGVRRCNAITDSLSNYSRQGGEMNEKCVLQSILDNCLLILENKIKSKITLKKNYSEKEVVILGNEGKLHQVFLNIITNAEQAIESKGKISITCVIEDDAAIVRIKDSGSGISKKDLSKISDPFFTTKAPGIGTGLGLSIVYSIIEEHRGSIECHSIIKEGTEFVIKLPLKGVK